MKGWIKGYKLRRTISAMVAILTLTISGARAYSQVSQGTKDSLRRTRDYIEEADADKIFTPEERVEIGKRARGSFKMLARDILKTLRTGTDPHTISGLILTLENSYGFLVQTANLTRDIKDLYQQVQAELAKAHQK